MEPGILQVLDPDRQLEIFARQLEVICCSSSPQRRPVRLLYLPMMSNCELWFEF
jgi:hypothetical protein